MLDSAVDHLQLVKGIYRVRMVVPRALRPIVGKGSLVKGLGTGDYATACQRARPYITEFRARLAAANSRHNRNVEPDNCMRRYWLTPPELHAQLDAEFHFDFDPCPYPRPEGFDVLDIDWGEVNYVNPPFRRENGVNGKGATHFFRKAIEEHRKGKTVVLVAPTQPYVNAMLEAGAELRSLGRVRWLDVDSGEPCPAPGPITYFILKGHNK